MECPAIPLKDIRTYLPFVLAMLAAFAVGGAARFGIKVSSVAAVAGLCLVLLSGQFLPLEGHVVHRCFRMYQSVLFPMAVAPCALLLWAQTRSLTMVAGLALVTLVIFRHLFFMLPFETASVLILSLAVSLFGVGFAFLRRTA